MTDDLASRVSALEALSKERKDQQDRMDHDIRALTDATNGMRGDFRELATEVRGLRELSGQVKDNTKAEAAHKAADRARQQITENSMKAIGLLLALPGAVGGAAGLIAYIVLSGN